MSEGARRIAAERQRQIEEECWSAEHDDQHDDESLAWAAVCYAAPGEVFTRATGGQLVDPWPASWWEGWDKRERDDAPTRAERIRELEKAGALIAAEIDRLLRGGSR